MKAMIFAAGLGTRLKPITDTLPKALVPVGGKPLLEHVLNKLSAVEDAEGNPLIDGVVVNVHHFAPKIVTWLDGYRHAASSDESTLPVMPGDGRASRHLPVDISDESAMLLETGGAVLHARRFLEGCGHFLIHNVDIFSNADLAALYLSHQESKADATLLVSQRHTSRYLVFDAAWHLVAWKNIQTGEVRTTYEELEQALASLCADTAQHRLRAFAGIHVIAPSLFPALQSAEEVFSITNFYWQHAADYRIRCVEAPHDFRWVDAGKPEALTIAAEIAKLALDNS